MKTVVNSGQTLTELLACASTDELVELAKVLTDNGEGRYSMSSETLSKIKEHQSVGTLGLLADVLEEELLSFGGHSVMNLMRMSPVDAVRVDKLDYHELVVDVAKKMGCKEIDGFNTFELEELIFEAELESMSPNPAAKLSANGPSTFDAIKDNAVAIGSVALSLGGSSAARSAVTFVATKLPALASGTAATIAAPAALIASVAYGMYEVGSPAFRVTKPAVMKVAAIRRRLVDEQINAMQEELKKCL